MVTKELRVALVKCYALLLQQAEKHSMKTALSANERAEVDYEADEETDLRPSSSPAQEPPAQEAGKRSMNDE